MQNVLNKIHAEMVVKSKPTILQLARWCKKGAEATKNTDKEFAEQLFILCEICLNHQHLTKDEIGEIRKKNHLILKNLLSKKV